MPDLSWLEELKRVRSTYRHTTPAKRRTMQLRALRFAALTIHTPWAETYRRWIGDMEPALPCADVFFQRRRRLPPHKWPTVNRQAQVKSHFARALLGFDDAACFDTWMVRYFDELKRKQWHGSTYWQWGFWLLKIYPAVYPWTRGTIIPQHCEVLRWIRTGKKAKRQQQALAFKFGTP